MMRNPVYLDYNATAPLRPAARLAMDEACARPLNASSVHAFGREGRRLVERARVEVAALVKADSANVIFNSGATEGNNTVLHHFHGGRILASAIEHPSVLRAGAEVELIPVTPEGILDLSALETLLEKEPRPALVSVMLVNNETGVIQPVAAVSALARKYGAAVHCDAVQAVGRIGVDIAALGADYLTLSAHKIGGPQGAGALVMNFCGEPPVLIGGGGQEKKARAGTENVAAIVGFGAAAREALAGLKDCARLEGLRARLEDGVAAITPQAIFYGAASARAPNTSLFALPGARSETLMMALDLEGVCVSNGSACTSGKVEPSHVLKAMGADTAQASGAIRVSTGWATTEDDIEAFLRGWEKCALRVVGG